MKNFDIPDNLTQNSTGLRPIYAKVEQLIKIKQLQQQHQNRNKMIKIIEPVPKIQIKMNINRLEQYKKRKQNVIQAAQQNILKQSNSPNRLIKPNLNELKTKTKSEKVINFLRSTQTHFQSKRIQTPCFSKLQNQREAFTPMRPQSKISRHPESVAGTQLTKRSGSNQKSSGGYSQMARLTQTSNSSTNPNKYLRKGHRMRQILAKHLNSPQDIQQQKQLVYLKQYDQWVPASLASYKKLQLQHFMNILTGGKKQQKKQAMLFQPVYL